MNTLCKIVFLICIFLVPAHAVNSVVCVPLHGESDPQKVLEALEKGANPNATCLSGMTPLHWARSGEIVDILLAHGANPNITDINGTSPLHLAPDGHAVESFVNKGLNPNLRDYSGNTPLHKNTKTSVVEALLKHKADPNARNGLRKTPLFTYQNLSSPSSQLLVTAGADVNAIDRYGNKYSDHVQLKRQKTPFFDEFLFFLAAVSVFGFVFFWMFTKSIFASLAKKLKSGGEFGTSSLGYCFFVFLNPIPIILTIVLNSYVMGVLYWMPGDITLFRSVLFLCISALYHWAWLTYQINHFKELPRSLVTIYWALKNVGYLILVPCWCFLIEGLTTPGSGGGSVYGFFLMFLVPILLLILLAQRLFFNRSLGISLESIK